MEFRCRLPEIQELCNSHKDLQLVESHGFLRGLFAFLPPVRNDRPHAEKRVGVHISVTSQT
jgi:hypothetical protein